MYQFLNKDNKEMFFNHHVVYFNTELYRIVAPFSRSIDTEVSESAIACIFIDKISCRYKINSTTEISNRLAKYFIRIR